jgi:hypothetical protein
MIYAVSNVQTKIPLTLTQSSKLLEPFYLFEFIQEGTTERISFFKHYIDISGYPERCNIFEMILDFPKGEYTYKVYESDLPNPQTIADTTGYVVQAGLCVIDSTDSINDSIYN